MKLHPITSGLKKNRYCGPGALSAITGRTTDEMALLLRKVSGKRAIKGVGRAWMLMALNHMGYGAVRQWVDIDHTRPTLAAWLKSAVRPEGTIFLVSAGNHWQVISGRRFVCSQTKEIVSLRHPKVHRRSRVKDAWRITK